MSRPVPLLEAFPAPPTFIPQSPLPQSPAFQFNPPPSKPPATPLPPVPGPSRLSESDTLLFLHSTGPSRSRRSSKLSLNNRDSFASTRSDSLLSASTSSQRSSPQTPSSAAQSLHRPSLAFSIDEHAESTDDLLQGTPLHALEKAPLDDDDLDVPKVMPSTSARPLRTPPRTDPRESIALSSITMPAPDTGDSGLDFDALKVDPRAPSPDIATILATTPRPRLTSLARRTALSRDEPWEEDFIDDYGQVRGSVYSVVSKASDAYARRYPEIDPSAEADNGNPSLVWDDPDESDSDLDLHTSLPQLMLHHGFLSPRSKLLPTVSLSASASTSSLSLAPSPVASVFSTAGTDAPPRDTRDTPKRRVRHRDGKLLAGGIGLTTGLGWSDSEDEDAPSALTRRVSSLNLSRSSLGLSRASSSASLGVRTSRASSSASLGVRTSRASSLGYVSRSRRAQSEYDTDQGEADEFGARTRGSVPPTSFRAKSQPRVSRAYTRDSTLSTGKRDSTLTTGTAETGHSTMSLPLMRSRSRVLRVMMADKDKPLPRTPGGSIRRTPSNVSGLRPRAVTGVTAASIPRLRDRASEELAMQSTPQSSARSSADIHAAPPPPLPHLQQQGQEPTTPYTPTPHVAKPQMRPLRLAARQPVLGGDRAPVPVPAVLPVAASVLSSSTTSSSLASSTSSSSVLSAASAASSATSVSSLSTASFSKPTAYSPYRRLTPTTPAYDQAQFQQQQGGSGIARPRPRTGTGMVYRTSTYAGPGPGVGGGIGMGGVKRTGKAVAL
ncbi:hypothetical protein DFH07DRAFT_968109 [Mycena maculata]|uniref:Uncharacterized protein n=1 Tax=Mycena maculata TaxID=230809 RepID=A0AAD7I3U8_9AGAR|nr:hypothetical protein DFH07DRAFT_968109 [Mycena maculata]